MDCEKFHIRAAMTIFGLLHNIAFFFFFWRKEMEKCATVQNLKNNQNRKGKFYLFCGKDSPKKRIGLRKSNVDSFNCYSFWVFFWVRKFWCNILLHLITFFTFILCMLRHKYKFIFISSVSNNIWYFHDIWKWPDM